MHHTNMVRDVVAGLQEVLQQKRAPTENVTTVLEPVYHVANAVQSAQQQLAAQLRQMKEIM